MNSLLRTSTSLVLSNNLNGIYTKSLVRSLATHWDPKFKKLRKNKFVKVKYIL